MSSTLQRHGRVYFLLSHFTAEDVAALNQLVAHEQAEEIERLEFPGVILALLEASPITQTRSSRTGGAAGSAESIESRIEEQATP